MQSFFTSFKFNLKNTMGKPLIYRWRSLEKQIRGVGWEKGKKGSLRI